MKDILTAALLKAAASCTSELAPPPQVILEAVHSMPKQGVASSFNFGRGLGLWEGLVVGLGLPYTPVDPLKWKTAMGLRGKDKGASVLRAQQLFPSCAEQLKLVKDHNKAEALLLAAYGQRI